jgi:hypothetical protein
MIRFGARSTADTRLTTTIEIERHRKSNPDLPEWLRLDYAQSLAEFGRLALQDLPLASEPANIQWIAGAVAQSKGALKLGALLAMTDSSSVDEILEHYQSWSKLYGSKHIDGAKA